MQGARQHILLEFFEKLFATMALGGGSTLAPLALIPLMGRRTGWRKFTPKGEVPRWLGYREIALFLAMALGTVLSGSLKWVVIEPNILAVFFLILSLGAWMLGERSSHALIPRLEAGDRTGPGLRNLFGWFVLGLLLASFLRGMQSNTLLGGTMVAMVFAGLPIAMAYRRGEPGLLPLGTTLTLIGVAFWNPWITAAGLGWVIPSAVLITYNVKGNFALRSLVGGIGAIVGLYVPAFAAVVAALALFVLSLEMWRFIVRLAIYVPLRTIHRFKVYGSENYASDGAGIVMSNHVSLADGWLLGSMTQRMVRFLVYDAYYKQPVSAFLLNLFRTIPISQGARREAIESLRKARTVIEEGHFAGIFPEGGITRSGHLHPFQKGFTRIVAGSDIPLIPAYMNGLWTSFVSFSEKRVWTRLGRFYRPFEIEFGTPLGAKVTAMELWRVAKGLEVNAAFRDAHHAPILPVAFLRTAAQHDRLVAVRDGSRTLTYGELASSALLLARHLNRKLRRKSRIGIFLPDGIEKVIAHVAAVLSGHVVMEVPVADADNWIRQHGLGTVITSQNWLEAAGLPKSDQHVLIGRVLERLDSREQWRTWFYRKLSAQMAWKQVCPHSMRKDSAAAIVESPRGAAVLSHRGIWSAAHGARRTLWFGPGTTVRNQISLSRPASLSIAFWMPLLNGATLVLGDVAAEFELVDGTTVDKAHADSKNVLVANPTGELEARYLPLFELAEASGAIAISSPPVDFMGEVQTGLRPGSWGRLPFGLELKETEGGIALRGPARLLRYLDAGDAKTQARIEEWLDVDVALDLNEHCYIESRAAISEPHTSSTPLPDQTS